MKHVLSAKLNPPPSEKKESDENNNNALIQKPAVSAAAGSEMQLVKSKPEAPKTDMGTEMMQRWLSGFQEE